MVPLRKVGGSLVGFFSSLFKNKLLRKYMVWAILYAFITMLVVYQLVPSKYDLSVGQVSPDNIFAPRSIVYVDQLKTADERHRAVASVKKIYEKDDQVKKSVQKDISDALAAISAVQNDKDLDINGKVSRLKSELPFNLPDKNLNEIVQDSPKTIKQLETIVNSWVGQEMDADNGITADNLDDIKTKLANRLVDQGFDENFLALGQALIKYYLRPNSFFNSEKYQQERLAAEQSVTPVQVTVKEDEKIVGKGEIVTEQQLQELQALGLTRNAFSFIELLGTALLVASLMVALMIYLRQQNLEIYQNDRYLTLLGIIVVMILLVSRAVIAINVTEWPQLSALFGYMAPLAAAGMLITILLDSRLAIFVLAAISILLGIMTGEQFRFAMVGFLGGITGVFSVSKLSQRGDLVRAGVYVSGANVLAILMIGLITGPPWSLLVVSSVTLGIINGILSSILTNGTLPYLETAFGITSTVRFLELSNPSNPLLKRLLMEAPGTYHHSIIVGNLAEAAAEAIGGETLVVRVGAYYHDIGKVKRPYFFIENQFGGENPHDKIAPSLSTLILTSHVKDGVEMAREHKLPQRIIDIIEQHHGRSLVTYFYHKAMESDRAETVSEEEFRYEGPKPRTKEAALVMLADSVEAAVRSLKNPTAGQVEGLVRKIIKDRLMDGQLDESDLTFKDLDAIANAFVRVLSGVFHSRIEYPDIKEMERRKAKHAGARK